VQRIFDLYDQAQGYKSIAMTLNREGYRTNKANFSGSCLSQERYAIGLISGS